MYTVIVLKRKGFLVLTYDTKADAIHAYEGYRLVRKDEDLHIMAYGPDGTPLLQSSLKVYEE